MFLINAYNTILNTYYFLTSDGTDSEDEEPTVSEENNPPEASILEISMANFPEEKPLIHRLTKPNTLYLDRIASFRKELEEHRYSSELKILDNVSMLTISDLEKGLFVCCQKLNDLLAGSSYALGIIPRKSQEFVATLAKPFLTTLPIQIFSTRSDKGGAQSDLTHLKSQNIVIFDDVAYSGSQLIETCRSVKKAVEKRDSPHNLYFVIPFLSSSAKKKIKNVFQDTNGNIRFTFITSDKSIQSVSDVLTNEELDQLQVRKDAPHLCLTLTEWKVPDSASVHVFTRAGCEVEMYINQSNTFVNEQIPPYKVPGYKGAFALSEELPT